MRSNRYANVAATLALVLSLAGTATAASVALITGRDVKNGSLRGIDLGDHSVGAKKLKRHSLSSRYLRTGSVTGRAVEDGTLTLDDLASGVIDGLQGPAGDPGPAGPRGPAGDSIKLAGYVQTDPQTLPGDGNFHSVWSMNFAATADQVFILTGSIGNPQAGCQVDEQVTIDGVPAPSVFNGAGFLTFSSGPHTISYEVRADCPIDIPSQEAILIPFTLP
jgi:hypothetical protein